VGGVGALTEAQLSQSGEVSFSTTCDGPCGPLGGAAAVGTGALWVQACLGGDIVSFQPSAAFDSCTQLPTVVSVDHILMDGLAFDSDGRLWGSAEGGIMVLSASLQGDWLEPLPVDCGGTDTICQPVGLAFDTAGFLWVGNGSIVAFSPATLAAGGGPAPDLQITSPQTAGAAAQYLAFDRFGDLWATTENVLIPYGSADQIVEFSREQLEGLAADDAPTPAFTIEPPSPSPPSGETFRWGPIAFDADGNLWALAWRPDLNLLRFSSAALADGGLPDIVITFSADTLDVGNLTSLLFDPIPPSLPIQPEP